MLSQKIYLVGDALVVVQICLSANESKYIFPHYIQYGLTWVAPRLMSALNYLAYPVLGLTCGRRERWPGNWPRFLIAYVHSTLKHRYVSRQPIPQAEGIHKPDLIDATLARGFVEQDKRLNSFVLLISPPSHPD